MNERNGIDAELAWIEERMKVCLAIIDANRGNAGADQATTLAISEEIRELQHRLERV